jgi:hypothetical protein
MPNLQTTVNRLEPQRLENLSDQFGQLPQSVRAEAQQFIDTDDPGEALSRWLKANSDRSENKLDNMQIMRTIQNLPRQWSNLDKVHRQAMITMIVKGRYSNIVREANTGNPIFETEEAENTSGSILSSVQEPVIERKAQNDNYQQIERWITENKFRHVRKELASHRDVRDAVNRDLKVLEDKWPGFSEQTRRDALYSIATGDFVRESIKRHNLRLR